MQVRKILFPLLLALLLASCSSGVSAYKKNKKRPKNKKKCDCPSFSESGTSLDLKMSQKHYFFS